MPAFRADRIAGFRLAAADPRAAARFFEDGLGFVRGDGATAGALPLRLGEAHLTLLRDGAAAEAPPAPADSPRFHHLAIVVSDIARAHARAMSHGARPISRTGPVTLPAASRGVTAWKFRTPHGQALELLQTPSAAWRARAAAGDDLFLGIDHTALGCSRSETALDFYCKLGLSQGPSSHNHGPEQDDLDGLPGVDLHIATLFTPSSGPHIELLSYGRSDTDPGTKDALAIVLQGEEQAVSLDAPDGHPIVFTLRGGV